MKNKKGHVLAMLIALSLVLSLFGSAFAATEKSLGDVDGNSRINEDDAIYLLQHILMPDMFPLTQNADYDKNGTLNEDDAIYLLQHVLMPDMFPLTPGSDNRRVRLSVGLPDSALVADYDSNALTHWVEETCNVDLCFIVYGASSSMATQIATTVAANQALPDILLGAGLSDAIIEHYGRDGYFLDLSEYFADQEGASKIFWDRMEAELCDYEQKLVTDAIRDPKNGAIYAVPTAETSPLDSMRYQPWINQEWLDVLGLDTPTNMSELYQVLVAFRDQDPNGNGLVDEIPLFGSQAAGQGAKVVDWLINMFCYYDSENPYVVGDDGTLTPVYTTDAYREALRFVNKLYKEGLLTSLAWTVNDDEMIRITMPSSGTSICGIFLGDLRKHVREGTDQLSQYVPLKNWGCAVRNNITVKKDAFITADCDEVDRAFEVLMALWSWEGSMRVRYGEYGVTWTEADTGAKSAMGLDAQYKLIADPMEMENTTHCWGMVVSTLNANANGETAQKPDNMDVWQERMYRMIGEAYQYFLEAERIQNPAVLCPPLYYTQQEQEDRENTALSISHYWSQSQTYFCTGYLDPNADRDWSTYLEQLTGLGLSNLMEYAQIAYDRQFGGEIPAL